ncbi:MAG TPA: WecB/TagA/CpsF family glycosyltransferase [Candidatus Acidoferrales bacterium]|nr:WecB/TagA/CpsF family glycosyltransferase [Candidatus Acidoferrales bacterium]
MHAKPHARMAGKRTIQLQSYSERPAIAMLGVTFDNLTLSDAMACIEDMVAIREPRYVVTANVDFLVRARGDEDLHRILLDAHLVLCDGTPLVWMSRLLGNPLPERVAGSDLVPALIRMAALNKHRLFFLGATPEANAQAIANVRKQFPAAIVDGYSPPFRPLPEMDNAEIAARIRAAQPDILFVAFGCPKAEKWMAAHFKSLGVPVTIGVGGTIDFLAGRMKRAPLWMQRAGVEWIFRLWQEPGRLFARYATDLWQFTWAMAWQLWRMKIHPRRGRPGEFCSLAISEPRWWRIRIAERFDATAVLHAKWILEGADGRHCLLDLADTDFIDSAGVGLLLRLRKIIHHAGNRLVLIAPSWAVQRALKLMQVEKFFLAAADAVEARQLIEKQAREHAAVLESNLDTFLFGTVP